MTPADATAIHEKLKKIFARNAKQLRAIKDEPGIYHVESKTTTVRGKPFWLGAIEVRKSYVSFHFIPVMTTELRKTLSPALKKRMQGKACFNFTTYDKALADELARVVDAGLKNLKPGELDLKGYIC
jgi:hypothetical protein